MRKKDAYSHWNSKEESERLCVEAEELEDGGYQFTIHGELDVDQGQLLELIAKAERGMAEIYIQKGEFPNGQC